MLECVYRFMLAWNALDLQVARSTGRNPANIAQLVRERDQYESLLLKLEIQR